MSKTAMDRRTLLRIGGSLWGSTLLTLQFPAIAARAADNRAAGTYQVLDDALANTLEAVAARILPTTSTPGAREAGAVWFIDAVLTSDDLADTLPLLRAGAAALDEGAGGSFPGQDAALQDLQLQAIEEGEFFALMHFLTLAGTFTTSEYGGNRGEVGWDLLAFERRHHWDPPFGYYDGAQSGDAE